MYEVRENTCYGVVDDFITEGLDSIAVGVFRLDENGYVVQYNYEAASMLGIGANTGRDDLHISRIDRILGSGMSDNFEQIINGSSKYVQKNLRCTNSNGRYMELDLCCVPSSAGEGTGRGIMGLLRNSGSNHNSSDDSACMRQKLHILSDVASALSSTCELSRILKVIMTGATASQGLEFNRAFLFLYHEKTNELTGHLACGPSSAEEAGSIWENLDSMRLSLGEMLDTNHCSIGGTADPLTSLIRDFTVSLDNESLLSNACGSGCWINLATLSEIDPFTSAFADRFGTRELALVPMVSKGNLLGLVVADNLYTNQPISDDAVQHLQILARQAAVAMERARLYDTERERIEEIERMNSLLAESQDQIIKFEKMSMIGELTSAIAHELRNPLTIVGGFANLMLKSDTSDEHREYLNIISSETLRAESVLHHVLDFSRASKKDNQDIDFSRLVRRNLNLLMGRLHRHEAEISLSLTNEKLNINGNNDQLSLAVYQFIKLAVEEFVPPGTVEVRTAKRDDRAVMWLKILCPDESRRKAATVLQQIFTENRASQRLTIMVAGETIKYHGGKYGFAFSDDEQPSLFIDLPLAMENRDESTHTGD